MHRRVVDGLQTLAAFVGCRYGRLPNSRAALEAWQARRIEAHLAWVLPRSPYTRERFADAGILARDVAQLPVIAKSETMAHFSRLNTAGVDRDAALALALEADRTRDFVPRLGDLTVGLSSGTSGHRGLFLASQAENNRWSGVALAKMLPGAPWETHRIALLHRANSHLYQGLGVGRLEFRYFDLLQPAQALMDALAAFQPTVIIAPPCALVSLAQGLASDRWRLRAPVRRLISVAEVLEPCDSGVIAEHFQRVPDVAYVATEGFLASTCPQGGLHLNEDLVRIEKDWMGDSRRTFAPIITDFHRRVVPTIRYRLNDLLTLAEAPCPCGSPFETLESIQGRSDDAFDVGGVVVLPDFLRRAVLQAGEGIVRYELVQTGPMEACASLYVNGASLFREDALRARFLDHALGVTRQLGADPLQWRVDVLPARDETLSPQKRRRVRRAWNVEG